MVSIRNAIWVALRPLPGWLHQKKSQSRAICWFDRGRHSTLTAIAYISPLHLIFSPHLLSTPHHIQVASLLLLVFPSPSLQFFHHDSCTSDQMRPQASCHHERQCPASPDTIQVIASAKTCSCVLLLLLFFPSHLEPRLLDIVNEIVSRIWNLLPCLWSNSEHQHHSKLCQPGCHCHYPSMLPLVLDPWFGCCQLSYHWHLSRHSYFL